MITIVLIEILMPKTFIFINYNGNIRKWLTQIEIIYTKRLFAWRMQ
jgi:hypothetical protein